MAETASAWVLTLNNKHKIALPQYQTHEYITTSIQVKVPLAPPHFHSMLLWRDRMIPLLDLAILVEQKIFTAAKEVVIAAYQTKPGTPLNFVGIIVRDLPFRIEVNDESACEPPEQYHGILRNSVLSCFSYNDQSVPIVNIAYLCSEQLFKNSTDETNVILSV